MCPFASLFFTLVTKINLTLVYQNLMENHKTFVGVTPVQPAFQYRGMKCKLIYRMELLLVTI